MFGFQACLKFQAKNRSQHHRDHGEPVIQSGLSFWLAKNTAVTALASIWFNGSVQAGLKRSPRDEWENAELFPFSFLEAFRGRGGSGPAGTRAICSGLEGNGSTFQMPQ